MQQKSWTSAAHSQCVSCFAIKLVEQFHVRLLTMFSFTATNPADFWRLIGSKHLRSRVNQWAKVCQGDGWTLYTFLWNGHPLPWRLLCSMIKRPQNTGSIDGVSQTIGGACHVNIWDRWDNSSMPEIWKNILSCLAYYYFSLRFHI